MPPSDPTSDPSPLEEAIRSSPAEERAPEAVPTIRVMTFRLGGEEYGVRVSDVDAVSPRLATTRVPFAPAHVLGLANLRGRIVPVVDPRPLLGVPRGGAEEGGRPRILVLRSGTMIVGLVVGAVHEVEEVAESAIEPPPSTVAPEVAALLAGILRLPSGVVALIDTARFMARSRPTPETARPAP